MFVALAISLVLANGARAGEPCEWASEKALFLHELKTKSGFPQSALTRFATGVVQTERTDGIWQNAKLEGILIGFVELMFEPESAALVDGTFSAGELGTIFYDACEEAL